MKNALRWKGNGRYRSVTNPTNNRMIVNENENWKILFPHNNVWGLKPVGPGVLTKHQLTVKHNRDSNPTRRNY